MLGKWKTRGVAALAAAGSLVSVAVAAPITITITNDSQTNGLSLTPLFYAFHNGNYDAFDVGSAASAGTERIAEVGFADLAIAEALAADSNAIANVLGAPGGFAGAPIIEPGESASITVDVDRMSQRFFTYLSMVLPSNDTFIGNGNAIELFDVNGVYNGDRTLVIDGNRIWDAGTEVNDLTNGPAFVAGQTDTGGADENGVVTLSDGINAIGVTLPDGSVLDPILANFAGDRDAFRLATISISAAPVPLPAVAPVLAGVFAFGAWRRRQNKAASA